MQRTRITHNTSHPAVSVPQDILPCRSRAVQHRKEGHCGEGNTYQSLQSLRVFEQLLSHEDVGLQEKQKWDLLLNPGARVTQTGDCAVRCRALGAVASGCLEGGSRSVAHRRDMKRSVRSLVKNYVECQQEEYDPFLRDIIQNTVHASGVV